MLKPSCRRSSSGLCTGIHYNLYNIYIGVVGLSVFGRSFCITWGSIFMFVRVRVGRLLRVFLREINVYVFVYGFCFVYSLSVFDFFCRVEAF